MKSQRCCFIVSVSTVLVSTVSIVNIMYLVIVPKIHRQAHVSSVCTVTSVETAPAPHNVTTPTHNVTSGGFGTALNSAAATLGTISTAASLSAYNKGFLAATTSKITAYVAEAVPGGVVASPENLKSVPRGGHNLRQTTTNNAWSTVTHKNVTTSTAIRPTAPSNGHVATRTRHLSTSGSTSAPPRVLGAEGAASPPQWRQPCVVVTVKFITVGGDVSSARLVRETSAARHVTGTPQCLCSDCELHPNSSRVQLASGKVLKVGQMLGCFIWPPGESTQTPANSSSLDISFVTALNMMLWPSVTFIAGFVGTVISTIYSCKEEEVNKVEFFMSVSGLKDGVV